MDAPQFNGDEPDPHPEGRWQREDKPIDVCDRDGCMRTIDCFVVTIQGLGQFCSRRCADAQQRALEQAS